MSVSALYLFSVPAIFEHHIFSSPEAFPTASGESTPRARFAESGQIEKINENQSEVLFSFDSPNDSVQWRSVNDTVMGGISNSQFQISGVGTALFTGKVSLENNGGFASVQSSPSSYYLADYEGISLRVKGDGKRYKISLRNSAYFASPRYQAVFTTKPGVWDTVKIPFSTLIATMHGNTLYSEPPLDSSKVVSFVLLISDKQEGSFKLEIDWIKAYRAHP
jgi:hypothetical protein